METYRQYDHAGIFGEVRMIKGTRRGITHSILILLVVSLLIGCVNAGNITTLNTTIIDSGDQAYIPFEVWAVLFIITVFFFFHALVGKNNTNITSIIAVILSAVTAWISGFIEFKYVETITYTDGNTSIIPFSYVAHPTWLSYIMLGFFFVSIVLTWRNVYNEYIASQPEWKQRRYRD